MRQRVREITSFMLSRPSTRYRFSPLLRPVTGLTKFKPGKTDGILAVNPMHKNHIDPQELDLTKPRLASYKQKWKRHQETVYWVDIQLTQRKGLNFYQTRSNAIILYDTLQLFVSRK